jgi:hypothetical protein
MSSSITGLLSQWLQRQLGADARAWLDGRRRALAEGWSERSLHITLGMIPRKLGKADLAVDPGDVTAAHEARAGWDPRPWSVADAARVLVLLETATAGAGGFTARFEDLCRNADVGELISLYRGLALYPDPGALEGQAGEGLRSNMRAVFEAVAHASPYPREVFGDARWNQMVLKALFVGSPLAPIQGLDERANPELAEILCDYAHERWAAGRPVSPELWRCVGPFATGARVDDLARALAEGPDVQREAAALALAASPDPAAAGVLAAVPALARRLAAGELAWDRVAAVSS